METHRVSFRICFRRAGVIALLLAIGAVATVAGGGGTPTSMPSQPGTGGSRVVGPDGRIVVLKNDPVILVSTPGLSVGP